MVVANLKHASACRNSFNLNSFFTLSLAVIFNNYDTNDIFPNKVDYSIRMLHTVGEMYPDDRGRDSWDTERVYPFFIGVDPRTFS